MWAPWDTGRCFADVITLSGGCRDVGDSKLETVSSGYTKDHRGASTSGALADGKTVGDPRTNGEGSSTGKNCCVVYLLETSVVTVDSEAPKSLARGSDSKGLSINRVRSRSERL